MNTRHMNRRRGPAPAPAPAPATSTTPPVESVDVTRDTTTSTTARQPNRTATGPPVPAINVPTETAPEWKKKSPRQRIAMVARGVNKKLGDCDVLEEMKLVDEFDQYRDEQELKRSDFQKLTDMTNAFKAGNLDEESLKIYDKQ